MALTGGNTSLLANGNTVIRWGGAAKAGEAPAMTEVDPNGRLVYEIWPAREGVTGGFNRMVWPLEDLTTTVTHYELMEGNRYVFNDHADVTGVTLKVNSFEGEGYNEAHVTRESWAPLYPEFPGKAPRVLPVRVTVTAWEIESMQAALSLDAESFGFADRTGPFGYVDPNLCTIYYRPYKGHGLFVPLPTDYNYVTGQLRTTMTSFGEFIVCFPDLEEVPYAPILIQPSDRGTVNQELPVAFFWTPRGLANVYHLQVSTDPNFATLDVNNMNLTETRYTLETAKSNMIYYWRVNTFNAGGISEWSTGQFQTVPPMVQMIVPNGGEQWQRGREYMIQWKDNLNERVVIELYKSDTLVQTIAEVPGIGAYEWEAGLDLEPGADYSIKIKSSSDDVVFDQSDEVFSIE